MKKSFIVKFFAMLMLLATSTTMSAQTQYLCITEKLYPLFPFFMFWPPFFPLTSRRLGLWEHMLNC